MEIDIRGYCYCILIFLVEHFSFGSVLTGELKHPAFFVAERVGVEVLIWQLSPFPKGIPLSFEVFSHLGSEWLHWHNCQFISPKHRASKRRTSYLKLKVAIFLSSHAAGVAVLGSDENVAWGLMSAWSNTLYLAHYLIYWAHRLVCLVQQVLKLSWFFFFNSSLWESINKML